MKLIVNFLPIIIIFLLVSYSDEMAQWSHTILGKLFAVVLIIFYTRVDVLFGLIVCALVILYYQTDYVEGFISQEELEGFSSSSIILPESEDDLANENSNRPENQSDTPVDVSLEILGNAYPNRPVESVLYDPQVDRFRQKNCAKGHLVHKGQIVKPEMAEHVFPEIEQKNFHKCNICDFACDFKFIDRKLTAQEDIMKPRSAR